MKIHDLYDKVRAFEEGMSKKTKDLSQCKKGCSRCCMVDLSVFQVEADNITNWFSHLSSSEQEKRRAQWKDEPGEACSFLVNDACTIYEARPLICRTQGLAFSFKADSESFIDICPLNEDMLDVMLETEVLNLDLLNLILSQVEKLDASGNERPRIPLKELRKKL